jgi:glycosyltransferase involved in cell wall biosynthesis
LASNVLDGATGKLRIVHVFRAPLGGLFRHVVDLAGEQTARGHDVRMFFDSAGLSPRVDEALASRFDAEVGDETRLRRIVVNGLRPSEFQPVAPNADAAEFVYVGELRAVKGVDILLEATARLGARTRPPTLALVGSGPEKDRLKELARSLGVLDRVSFPGVMSFRKAMALGRILVAPSRLESLPYVVLEAAASRVPIVATAAGGVPEIFGPFADRLGPCGDAIDLARRMANALDQDPSQREAEAADLSRFVAGRFTIESMADGVLTGYRDALARRRDKTVSAAAQPLQPRAEG